MLQRLRNRLSNERRYIYPGPDPFIQKNPPMRQFRRVKERHLPDLRYAIFFTPRTGSSRLTDLIQSARVLGDAAETFNPQLVAGISDAMGSTDIEDYCDSLLRVRSPRGVFSAEVYWPHMISLFRDADHFMSLLEPTKFVWLTRDDLVAQAVSMMAQAQTNLGHANTVTPEELAEARARVQYNPVQLRALIRRVLWSEQRTEAFFRARRIEPLRLTYEKMIATPNAEVVQSIAAHVGVPVKRRLEPESDHTKMSGRKNQEFADRFRRENRLFLSWIMLQRARFRRT